MSRTHLLPLVAVAALAGPGLAADEPVTDFTLKDLSGKEWRLREQKNKATILVFLSCECPMSNAYVKPLGDLAAKYRDRDVAIIGVNANKEESVKRVAAHAKEFAIGFPILKDDEAAAAKALGVKVTPEAVVLDEKFVVRYRGGSTTGTPSGCGRPPRRRGSTS